MATRGIKPIAPVPTANDFLDIVLSKTQRKTPTVIHKNFKISRIRNFYMRKVKFTQDSFDEKLGAILADFPVLDNLHPFLSSLLNVLYDKNHYKLALGQLHTARHLIDQIAKDYVRLLKFGDSLYRCKQLKKAALGRMATVMKRQKDPLAYLEQVRQHISRLPTIDPNTRTLLVCGYPNVGKSSFVNKVTRADVDVQPYAFTTKSLFVGHLDYNYLRWQVIDTPGVLDHPLEEMNTIEMQSITALAHLRCAVLYFMDLSENCGYTVEAQCKLFHSIKPLFANKPTLLVINKIDVMKLEDLPAETRELVDQIANETGIKVVQTSCHTEEGVMDVRNAACDALLAHRVESKLKGNKIDQVANRIHVAMPKPRDNVKREPFIPEAVLNRRKYDSKDPFKRKLEKDIEAEQGGAGVYSIDMRKNWILSDPSWKDDAIPEIMDGKNVADFIDPDIAAKLEALEKEEERLEAEGFYDSDDSITNSEDEREAEELRAANMHKAASQQKKRMKNRPILPRTTGLLTISDMSETLTKAGIDPSRVLERAQLLAKARSAGQKRKRDASEEAMDVDDEQTSGTESEAMEVDDDGDSPRKRRKRDDGSIQVTTFGKRVPQTDRRILGMKDASQVSKAIKLRNLGQRKRNMLAKAGESDRAIRVKMPKHLYSGKRKAGKTNRR